MYRRKPIQESKHDEEKKDKVYPKKYKDRKPIQENIDDKEEKGKIYFKKYEETKESRHDEETKGRNYIKKYNDRKPLQENADDKKEKGKIYFKKYEETKESKHDEEIKDRNYTKKSKDRKPIQENKVDEEEKGKIYFKKYEETKENVENEETKGRMYPKKYKDRKSGETKGKMYPKKYEATKESIDNGEENKREDDEEHKGKVYRGKTGNVDTEEKQFGEDSEIWFFPRHAVWTKKEVAKVIQDMQVPNLKPSEKGLQWLDYKNNMYEMEVVDDSCTWQAPNGDDWENEWCPPHKFAPVQAFSWGNHKRYPHMIGFRCVNGVSINFLRRFVSTLIRRGHRITRVKQIVGLGKVISMTSEQCQVIRTYLEESFHFESKL